MAEEKLYTITYEHKLEPYLQTTRFSIGLNPKDAELRFLSENPQAGELSIVQVKEFGIPGYKITLERIIK